MLCNLPPNVKKVCVHTGNILSLNEVKRKAGQNPTDELVESLKITLTSWMPKNIPNEETIQIHRQGDDLLAKLDEEDRNGLKISVKVFISTLEKNALRDALNNVLAALQTECVDSLVLAYAERGANEIVLADLKQFWLVLEEFVDGRQLAGIGVADVDTEVFVALHSWAKVKPSIVQINLLTCCVVPPALQAFTKENDVQLLTHSDPFEILPRQALADVFGGGGGGVELYWALRYQVHVKCRGVLASKGYSLCVSRTPGPSAAGPSAEP